MPVIISGEGAGLSYELDDFTDPWEERPFLVLQHGNGRSAKFWYRWIPLLGRHFRIIRPDTRGLGHSRGALRALEDITLDRLIADLIAVMDDAGADTVHYCGESMGGILGLALAATHPQRLRSLTLIATPVFIEQSMKERYAMGHGSRMDAMKEMGIRNWVEKTTATTRLPADREPGLFKWYVDEFVKNDAEVQVAMSTLVNGANARDFLKDVRLPVLGLYPTAGQITTENQERILKDELADFRMVHLPTDYHMVQLLHAEECCRELMDFCAARDST